jgi:hypothetical protein
MINYQATIGYKAIITIQVKAENEKEAKEMALEIMKQQRDKISNRKVHLEDDNFKVDGILNLDETWNQF